MTERENEGIQTPIASAESEAPLHAARHVIRYGVPVLLLVLAICLGFVAVSKSRQLDTAHDLEHARVSALATAREFAIDVTTYDPTSLDKSFETVLDMSTGDFHDQYATASKSLRETIITAKGRAEGKVVGAGVVKARKDRVEVIVFVDQTVTNRLLSEPRVDRSRMSLVLERHGQRWLVSDMRLR